MQHVLIVGAGKIGSLIAFLLATSNDYHVYLADIKIDRPDLTRLATQVPHLELISLNVADEAAATAFLKKYPVNAIVSSLPYYHNEAVATLAKQFDLHYFDLTEDVHTTQAITQIAKGAKTAFVPQCGLAPGFISIVAHDLMKHFSQLDTVKMRVGALPINVSNSLQYALTWSTEGLINEYGNHCHAVIDGKEVTVLPLEGLEDIEIDGLTYEAFNTSGGIGSLAKSYFGKIRNLDYKTIRYPGHCAKIRFLMNDLKLNQDRETLKRILENAIPKTHQDEVLVYVSVTGMREQQLMEENYVRKFYPKKIGDFTWTAIQLTTASGLCSVLDRVMSQPSKYQGFVIQEVFSLEDITQNRFGNYYQ
jgi:saccharopine dehydrogenase-like NADP-dependent oxidoreductase